MYKNVKFKYIEVYITKIFVNIGNFVDIGTFIVCGDDLFGFSYHKIWATTKHDIFLNDVHVNVSLIF